MPTLVPIPEIGMVECNLKPVVPRSTDRMEGRRTEMQKAGTWWWTLSLQTKWLEYRDFGRMDAFSMRAGDDGEFFLAHDVFRPRPIRMDNGQPLSGTRFGGGAFDGTGTVTARTAFTATVSGMPVGNNFLLSEGDYVEFRASETKRSLHVITLDQAANSSGLIGLRFKHALDLQHFPVGMTVNFEKPSCTMQIDPGSYDGKKSWQSRQPSFTATEVFLP